MKIIVPEKLARSSRPGYPAKSVDASAVEESIHQWKEGGIRSILCLLDDAQLAFYNDVPGGLLGSYRKEGFNVGHVPVRDHKHPALSDAETAAVLEAYASLPKPVLVHCSAGIDRTGAAIRALGTPDAYGIRPLDEVPPSEHPRNKARLPTPQNAMFVIHPYLYQGTWVFDDTERGLVKEPFVLGVPEMIDQLLGEIDCAGDRFRLIFSQQAFPGAQRVLRLLREEFDGGWYSLDEPPMEGWLCPALFRYFEMAPSEIHLRAEGVA